MWDYRIVRVKQSYGFDYSVKEVFFDKRGKPKSMCEPSIGHDTLELCMLEIDAVSAAKGKPVLNYPEDFDCKQ